MTTLDMMKSPEMIGGVRAWKYKSDEGFLDETTEQIGGTLSPDIAEVMAVHATVLAEAADVPFEIAEEYLLNHSIKLFCEHLRSIGNN
jgi:hypothetical protein